MNALLQIKRRAPRLAPSPGSLAAAAAESAAQPSQSTTTTTIQSRSSGLSPGFTAAFDAWVAAVMACWDAAIDGRDDLRERREDLREIVDRLNEMVPGNSEDQAVARYASHHWHYQSDRLGDADNPFYALGFLTFDSPILREVIAFWGRPFVAWKWLGEWRDAGGIALAVDRRAVLCHGPDPDMEFPSAAEVRELLLRTANDHPQYIEEIEATVVASGPHEFDIWSGVKPTIDWRGGSHAHA